MLRRLEARPPVYYSGSRRQSPGFRHEREGTRVRELLKRRWVIAACAAVLIGLTVILVLVLSRGDSGTYVRGKLPRGVTFAQVSIEASMSAEALYEAYDDDADPAHPVLDVKTSLSISNLGGRPGAPRPQDLKAEYPKLKTEAPTSSSAAHAATINPGPSAARITPGITLPSITLPDFYLVNGQLPTPQFTGRSYELSWKYTGGRQVTYTVSLSTDGGQTFRSVAENLAEQSHAVTLPKTRVDRAVLRVSAMLGDRVYKTADTSVFAIVEAPKAAPTPIQNFVDPQVKYVSIPGLRISSASRLPVWFKAENNAKDAEKVIWELSKAPFWGTSESFGSEAGVVASGTVDMSKGGEFSLDLNGLCDQLSKPDSSRSLNGPFLARQSTYQLYLRVVPLDKTGVPIGDPGRGLSFTYGLPDIAPGPLGASMAEDPKIQMKVYVPYYWEYRWERISPAVLNRDIDDDSDFLLFAGTDGPHAESFGSVVSGIEDATEGAADSVVATIEDAVAGQQEDEKGLGSRIISKAVQVEIQVATSPFADSASLGLTQPSGLVYSWVDTAPDIGKSAEDGATYYTPTSRGLEYDQFVPSKQTLAAMGGVTYYVRGIFYVPDAANPSVLHPYPSETLTVAFRATDADANEVKKLEVKSDIPYVQFLQYMPVQWQHPEYDEYFEVARHIEAEEMNFSIEHDGDFLLPYAQHVAKYGWTREQYQAQLDEMLPPGRVIHYRKADPGFWEEFFDLLDSIYSGVSEAYADAKTSVVSLVDYIPLIGDDARGYLKMAARAAIDYGLASIGLPPSLPNIDQLASGGMDYLMKVAVDEALRSAGVPADSAAAAEISEKVREEVANGITTELEKAILAQRQNPLNASFLRLELKKLYAPAYVDVFVCNYSQTRATRPGELVFSSGNGFDVYKTRKVTIPALKPGEHTTVRIYLDHLRNKYDGYNKYFDEKYNGTSGKPYKMGVYTYFELPDVHHAAQEQGIQAAPLPYVTEFTYDHDAYSYRYEREFVPAEPIFESDSAPNTHDFLD